MLIGYHGIVPKCHASVFVAGGGGGDRGGCQRLVPHRHPGGHPPHPDREKDQRAGPFHPARHEERTVGRGGRDNDWPRGRGARLHGGGPVPHRDRGGRAGRGGRGGGGGGRGRGRRVP